MHDRARDYVKRYATQKPLAVVEIGSMNVNGQLRDLFPNASRYVGMDIRPGKGVDCVGDAAVWEPSFCPDLVICCEVLEHTAEWAEIVTNAASWLPAGGRIVITCAGPGRPVHSHRGGKMNPGEWYMNIDPAALYETMQDSGLRVDSIELHMTDTRASGVKT